MVVHIADKPVHRAPGRGDLLLATRGTDGATVNIPHGGEYNVLAFRQAGDPDDYPMFQRAAAALAGKAGWRLIVPADSYTFDRYRITGGPDANDVQDIAWTGCSDFVISGYGATISVKGDFNRSADFGTTYHYSYRDTVIPFKLTDCANWRIEGFTLDGNADQLTRDPMLDAETGAHGGVITYRCQHYELRDIYTHHWQTDGVLLGQDGAVADQGATLTRVRSRYNARQGLSAIQVNDLVAWRCRFEDTGLTGGSYGGHAPMAGVDIEPNHAPPTVDILAGNMTFAECVCRNNQGPQFVTGNNGLATDGVTPTFEGILAVHRCSFADETSTYAASFGVVAPLAVVSECAFVIGKPIYLDATTRTSGVSVRFERNDVRGPGQLLFASSSTPVTVEGNTFTCTAPGVLATTLFNLANASVRFRRNTTTVPATAHPGSGYKSVTSLASVAECEGNRWVTDLAYSAGNQFTVAFPTTTRWETFSGQGIAPGAAPTWAAATPYTTGVRVGGTVNADGFTTFGTLTVNGGSATSLSGSLKIGGGTAIVKHLSGTTTYDPPSLATGAQQTTTVTVTGAALGDEATCAFGQDLQGTGLRAYVSAANTVTVVHRNDTGATVDLASGTLRASVWQH